MQSFKQVVLLTPSLKLLKTKCFGSLGHKKKKKKSASLVLRVASVLCFVIYFATMDGCKIPHVTFQFMHYRNYYLHCIIYSRGIK